MADRVPFGEVFGEMVRAKRRELRITQETMAEELFGAADRKGDISRLENGKTPRPQPFTVQRIADYLGLSSDEIDRRSDLARELSDLRSAKGSLSKALADVKELSRNQLEALSAQFEISDADSLSDGDLRNLLCLKAEEYRAYRADIEAIDERTIGLGNLKKAAKDAAEQLDFEQVETLLLQVQGVELDVAAETTEIRAKNALLRGRVQQAYELLSSAADSFRAIGDLEASDMRNKYLHILFNHGIRFSDGSLALAVNLIGPAIGNIVATKQPRRWDSYHNNLASVLSVMGSRASGDEAKKILSQAVEANLQSLRVQVKEEDASGWATSQNNLGLSLYALAIQSAKEERSNLIERASEAYESSLAVRRNEPDKRILARTLRNFAALLIAKTEIVSDVEKGATLTKSIDLNRSALDAFSSENDPMEYAGTCMNLAICLETLAMRVGAPRGRKLLEEAEQAYSSCLKIFEKEKYPTQWAMTQENLALLSEEIAEFGHGSEAIRSIDAGIKHLKNALTVYDVGHIPVRYDHVMKVMDRLKAKRKELSNTA